MTTRRVKGQVNDLTDKQEVGNAAKADDADKISVAGSVSDVTPPPQTANHPQLNPFTPEWFAQVIGAAATAPATALENTSHPQPALDSVAPRRLNDRKVPDFC